MSRNNWYVLTGGPSAGKTTLLAEFERRGYKIIPEAARTVIDEAIDKGITVEELRADEKQFQDTVAKRKAEIEASLDPDTVTFFDRGMHDTLAYLQHYDYAIDDWEWDLLNESKYNKVFLLEPFPFKEDYARVEGEEFRNEINQLLSEAYSNYQMEPVTIPAIEAPDRADVILRYIEEE